MKNMLVIMGATLAKFSQQVNYLICSPENLLKLKEEREANFPKKEHSEEEEDKSRAMLAIDLGITIVSEEWIGECACKGQLLIPPSLDDLLRKAGGEKYQHQLDEEYGEDGMGGMKEREVFSGVSVFVPLSRFDNAELVCFLNYYFSYSYPFLLFFFFFFFFFFIAVMQHRPSAWSCGHNGPPNMHPFHQ